MFKSVWVKAHFQEEGYWTTEEVVIDHELKYVEKGFFKKEKVAERVPVYETQKKWVVDWTSDHEIDGIKLSEDIEETLNSLSSEGYEVISITPVISGKYKHEHKAPVINASDRSSYGWGYGFSYTEGVNILVKKV